MSVFGVRQLAAALAGAIKPAPRLEFERYQWRQALLPVLVGSEEKMDMQESLSPLAITTDGKMYKLETEVAASCHCADRILPKSGSKLPHSKGLDIPRGKIHQLHIDEVSGWH